MSERIPCPACGCENGSDATTCHVCGYRFADAARDSGKCARCGSLVDVGFEFCQICGLRLQSRRVRPVTQSLRLLPRPRSDAGLQSAVAAVAAGVAKAPAEPSPEPASQPAGAGPGWGAPPTVITPPRVVGEPLSVPRRAPGATALRLVLVRRDGSEGEAIPLGGVPLTIGRSQADLCFTSDEFLAATHARVEPEARGVRVTDLTTQNGVYVRITRPEVVVPGDCFLLGHHLLRLGSIPTDGREAEPGSDGVRGFGTPLQPAWGRLTLVGRGGAQAEVHYLRHPQIVFGRELGDIVFPADPFVSWQHAQLSMELVPPATQGGTETMTVTLTDLRSANGTYLRARGAVTLQAGDMFRVGDQIFRVRMH